MSLTLGGIQTVELLLSTLEFHFLLILGKSKLLSNFLLLPTLIVFRLKIKQPEKPEKLENVKIFGYNLVFQ